MELDDVAGLSGERRGEQIGGDGGREADGMSASSFEFGDGDGEGLREEMTDDGFDGGRENGGAIDQGEKNGACGWEGLEAALQRTHHAAIGVGVLDENGVVPARDTGGDAVTMRPDHYDDGIADWDAGER